MRSDDDGAVYRFDRFRLDVERGTVQGPGDEELVLRPKAFALLRHLVEHPGRLHRREDLLEALWPDVVVTDDSLTQCVSDLRRAFGDRAHHVLRTLPRRGYVLAAEVQRGAPPRPAKPPPAAPEPIVPQPSAPGDAAAGRRDTLVVDVLDSPDGDPGSVRLARMLATDLAAELVRFEDLRVVARPGGGGQPGYRVRGEVHLVGMRLLGTIRLEDAVAGAALWAERLDQILDGGAALPTASISALAAAIDLQIARESLRRARQRPFTALTAREFCLLGRELHQRGTEHDTRAAQRMFVSALAADPDYAAAYAWQAFTVMRAVTHGWGALDWQVERERALRLARRAVDIEPDSPLCLSALAFALALCQRWDDAVATARMSLRTGRPADFGTRTSCGEVLAGAGHPEEAAEAVRETLALDPHCPPRTRAVLGRALLLAGRLDEALDELRRCAARLPDYAPCFRSIVVAAFESGRMDEARAAFREVQRLQPNWVPGDEPVLWFLRYPEQVERFLAAFRAVAAAGCDRC